MRTASNGLPSTTSIALDLLGRRRSRGLTISELASATERTRSNASAILSTLHRENRIVRLAHRRRGQSVYVLPKYVAGRPRRGRNATTRSTTATTSTRSTTSTSRRSFVDRSAVEHVAERQTLDLDAIAVVLDDVRRLIETGATFTAWGRIVDALDALGHEVES